ncbi:YlmH family RNA-binding protein [Streptococcus loxodontisalivarius]|uniref:RNA-binding protein YlmH n=1 Tax=Streptococcus loxodontisalivarius TaxID=1349415 RepID=A0ABS2PSY1_9STRE|nr:YlmH/Sll1252 family protein [Streptococcus loxodontisalivarius]MBM7642619.1 RNA-binding protein YlmH [Streptococcus loxodontisalivarius]
MATDHKDIYQHFRPSETDFVDKVFGWVSQVDNSYTTYLTDFLDPRQVTIAQSIIASSSLQSFVSSDFIGGEYARLLIAPDYYQLDQADFEISLLEVDYNRKFNQISHGQVMGTLINQLGIRRTVFGDILLTDDHLQVYVMTSMLSYFQENVKKIGKASVKLRQCKLEERVQVKESFKEDLVLVSSLRLDKVVASVLKLSRSVSLKLIASQKVKLNYSIADRASEELSIGDLVSVRGYGRFTLDSLAGLSKQGKHKLIIKRTT